MNQWDRTERLVGEKGLQQLRQASVLVVGLGGVGSHCVEALARCGIGRLTIVDHDTIALSNCNRQLHAMHSTMGKTKVDVMKNRIQDIDPTIEVNAVQAFYCAETAERLMDEQFSFVVDAIDSLASKVELLDRSKTIGLNIVTVLGAASRLDPTQVRVAPLKDTSGDPLAALVRKRLRRRSGLDGIMAVYSLELPRSCLKSDEIDTSGGHEGWERRRVLPSMAFVPSAMGLAAASVVIRHLIGEQI